MATVKRYITELRQRQIVIARLMGCDLDRIDKQQRVLVMSLLALIAVLVKTLTDKTVITDAELLATLNSARDEAWPPEPIDPPPED